MYSFSSTNLKKCVFFIFHSELHEINSNYFYLNDQWQSSRYCYDRFPDVQTLSMLIGVMLDSMVSLTLVVEN
jgi:hypothetical protein